MSLKIFTPCWGPKHIDLLKRALSVSLSWPKNFQAVKNAEWVFVSENRDEADEIQKHLRPIFPATSCSGYFIKDISKYEYGGILCQIVQLVIKKCLDDKSPLLMATPDFIFGDGTIQAFQKIASEPGSCATIAHLRVLPDVLDKLTEPLDNHELMKLGLAFPHKSWSDDNNLYYSGVKHQEIAPGLHSVQHYMPSPFYVNFLEEDLENFKRPDPLNGKPPGFGMWDHLWPTDLLQKGRLRFIGSSDLATMIEVTDPDKNVPPIDDQNRPGFFRDHFHNEIQKQFISCFRG